MSYKCRVCNTCVPHGVSMMVHRINRKVVEHRLVDANLSKFEDYTRTEIAKEIPVCRVCSDHLAAGHTLAELVRYQQQLRQIVEVAQPTQPPKEAPPIVAVSVAPKGKVINRK